MTDAAFDELLRRLVIANVRFVLVGGLAVNAWGVVRGTKDVDIVPDPDPENLGRLAEVVVEAGGRVQTGEAFAGSSRSISALLVAGERVYVETTLGHLDVVHGLPGIPPYHQLRSSAAEVDVLGTTVDVCSLEALRAMKQTAGRTRDLADLEDLDAAHPRD